MDEQNLMKERIPNCEQVVFQGAPHGITWDQPDECAKAVLQFIRRYPVTG